MTNGEKIQTILNVDRDCIEVHGENGTMTFTVTQDWWNAEYQEPTDKNFTKSDIDAIVKAINAHWELIIDEIRAEIEAEKLEDSPNFCVKAHNNAVDRVLGIIDKYKAEMEANNV